MNTSGSSSLSSWPELLVSIVWPATGGPKNELAPYFHSIFGLKVPICSGTSQASLSGTSATGTSGGLQKSRPPVVPPVVVPPVVPVVPVVLVDPPPVGSGPVVGSPVVVPEADI